MVDETTLSWSERSWAAVRRRPDPLTSIAFTVPIFLLYHLGILAVERRTNLDFVSSWVQGLLKESVPAYVTVTLAFSLLLLVVVWVQQKRGVVPSSSMLRVMFEAAACAVLIMVSMGWATHRVLRTMDTAGLTALNMFEKLVLASGAGFYEEFIFRALLVTGGSALIGRIFRVSARGALMLAVIVSSLLFALAHNVGVYGEPFVLEVAGYRVIEGILFALLYLARGFATVAYAHTFYEALVFFVYT
jgi:membrane protease YdiL (CAAX protease family)